MVHRSVVLCVVAGCWNSAPRPTAQPSSLESGVHDPKGNYRCSIDDASNLDFLCSIAGSKGKLTLTKLNGAERIRGEVVVAGDGFTFTGERLCMWEDCTQKLTGRFEPVGHGEYRGTFREAPLVVRLVPAPAAVFEGEPLGDPHDGSAADQPVRVDTPGSVGP